MDVAVLAGVLPHGLRRSPAVRATVPGHPEEQQLRGLLHPGLPGAAHRQHPAHLLLVRGEKKMMFEYLYLMHPHIHIRSNISVTVSWHMAVFTDALKKEVVV